MKNMNSHYNKLKAMTLTIKDIILNLEEKIGNIQDNAWNENRDMTDREKKICDKIDEQITDLKDCVEYIENAMGCLEEYTD